MRDWLARFLSSSRKVARDPLLLLFPLLGLTLLLPVWWPVIDALPANPAQRGAHWLYPATTTMLVAALAIAAVMVAQRLRRSERAESASRAQYRAATEGSLDAFMLLSIAEARDGRILEFVVDEANERALTMLRQSRAEVVGVRLRKLLPEMVRRRLYRRFFRALEAGKPIEEELEMDWGGDLGLRWLRLLVTPTTGGLGVALRDIDDTKQAQRSLELAANIDSLTSLPNRRKFIDSIGLAIERCKEAGTSLCLLFIDLDNFKNVNDTLGHDVGDLLLQAVAERLRYCIRADDLLWRIGGDEFVVSMENLRSRSDAEIVCRRIAEAFATPMQLPEITVSTSASIGIAFCPDDAENVDLLLKYADQAMYEAKDFGSGTYRFFRPEMGQRRSSRVKLEQSLRNALRRYELFLEYQPQIRLADGKVIGLEALVRWQHPEKGLISPGEFIPVAEESNLIHLLGDYVFQVACSQVKKWEGMGLPPVRVAVNVSPRQFAWEGITERLLAIIDATDVGPGLMEIEITEGAIMKDADAARRKLAQLKRRGIALAVDDFGTGHSSLASLQTFPIDKLKIDRSFVVQSDTPKGVAVLRAIVVLAHSLRIEVIAEGVETEAQQDILRGLGCDQIQGFLIARPTRADDVPALIETINRASARQST